MNLICYLQRKYKERKRRRRHNAEVRLPTLEQVHDCFHFFPFSLLLTFFLLVPVNINTHAMESKKSLCHTFKPCPRCLNRQDLVSCYIRATGDVGGAPFP